jgi:uncharacterized heparinase superfamily protein
MTRQNMLDREHPLRFDTFAFWRGFSSHGLKFAARSNIKISGLGARVIALRPGDQLLAQEISKGKFSFAGATSTGLPHRLFDLAPPTPAWQASLHSLNWLQHFVASGQDLHRIIARLLVEKWSENYMRGLECSVHFRALISLSLATPFLVDSSQTFGTTFFRIVENHIRRVMSLHPANAMDRLLQVISLQYASLAFRTPLSMRDDANASFGELVNKVILPDGGHVSRDPLQLFETLQHVVPMKNAMLANLQPVPQSLSAAIERMIPMLRMLSHGDHGLANFQGAGAVTAGSVHTILETDRVHGRPLLLAPHSGYGRLAHRSGLLIIDVGAPARCNSALAVEFSDGQHRIFSNCGMPPGASLAWQRAASSLAAHNTMEIDGISSSTRNSPFAEVINSPRGSLAKCQNQMAGKAGTITHARDLFLSQDGRDLRGEDSIVPADHGFTLRFHLHPTVRASAIRNGTRIVLVLPNRAAWSFSTRGGTVSLEESVFLGEEAGPRKTQQIVIRRSAQGMSPVKWALRRVERATTVETDPEEAPQLPF